MGIKKLSLAVVGAGPGGLATAMLLAASGASVDVYESEPIVGGRTMRLASRGPGGEQFGFDRGPTFFLMPFVLEEVFAACGKRLGDYVELTRLDPMYRLVIGRENAEPIRLDCTQDTGEMARRIGAIEPRDAEGFLKILRENRRKLEVFTPILRSPFRSMRDLARPELLRALPWLGPTKSVSTYLASRLHSPYTRLALSFQSKYLGMSPYKCPSLFSILPFIEYEYGIWHPTGGCNALMQAMATAVVEMGGRVHCGSPVEAIEFEGRRARGVTVRGASHRHDHIVVNADATWAMRTLIPERLRPGWTDRKIEKARYSCSTFMLYLGLDRMLDMPHHTIYISSQYEQNLRDIEEGRLTNDPSVYICNPSRLDTTLAPSGKSSLYVLAPTANTKTGMDWKTLGPVLREKALDRVCDLAGRDVRSAIVTEIRTTPDDWRAANIQFGATFNLAHNLGQMLHKRPQHRLPGCDGVWLAGGGTHPGSGLPVIFLSAQITSRLLCEEAGLAWAGNTLGERAARTAPQSSIELKPLSSGAFAAGSS